MTVAPSVTGGSTPVAIVGLACRYPDADDPPALLDLIATGRRTFRRIPPCRVDLADYFSASTQTPDATYSTRAALIEGWQFDRAAFGVSESAYHAADPAHWLALETAGRALAAAGFPHGIGLPANSAGVIIGNTLAGDVSRASALRLRWPYSRQVLAEALFAADIPAGLAETILRTAAARYLAPFPAVGAATLAGAMPGTLSTVVGSYLGFRGGGFTIDGGGASSLVAVATACLALTSGELDVAVAGGVDVSLDPLELVGMAKSGVLATGDMRIYDENPTGFLPGEGCGMLLLMRTADARAARLPVYAEILGWGMAAAGLRDQSASDSGTDPGSGRLSDVDSQLLALRNAYTKAGVDPADVQFIEGSGTGTATADETELAALTALRAGARRSAALGSIAANIGNTRAAAGAAGLIKTVLALANGVVPPVTGCRTPHPMLREAGATLHLPTAPDFWPQGSRLAGVSAMGTSGLNVHLVLGSGQRAGPAAGWLRRTRLRSSRAVAKAPQPRRSQPGRAQPGRAQPVRKRPVGAVRPAAYLLHAPDQAALAAVLARIAQVAPWLSDGEMQDLSWQLARDAISQGQARVAIVATRQEQLARLAAQAITLLPKLRGGLLAVRPGIFAADGADGRVTLLFSGQPRTAGSAAPADPARASAAQAGPLTPDLSRTLAALRWLDALGVHATAAVGHGAGELAGLIWADCVSPADAQALYDARIAALGLPPAAATELLTSAIGGLAGAARPPRRRLISGCTGTELAGADEIPGLLSTGITSTGRLSQALTAGAVGASLLLETGPGRELVTVAGQLCKVPAVSLDGGPDDERHAARAVAALFAVGALTEPAPLFEGRPGRPADIWHEQIFITNPCQAIPLPAETGGDCPVPSANPAASTTSRPTCTWPTTSADANGVNGTHPAASAASQASVTRPADAIDSDGPGRAASSAPAIAGVRPWSLCYARQLREPGRPIPAGDDRPWRLHTGGCEPLRPMVYELFTHDQAADRTLAVLGSPDDPLTTDVALQAARDATNSGQLVVISQGPDLNGLWASLHAEHPALGITVLNAPPTADGLGAASRIAGCVPGEYRELVVDADGSVSEPVMVPVPLTGGRDFPLGQDDVVVVSRSAAAAGLALAQVLACSGAAVAIIGRSSNETDTEVIATLEQLRSAGARVTYEVVDTADSTAMSAAVHRIERRLGPVTAVGHAAGPAPRLAVSQLRAADLRRHITKHTVVLDRLVSAVPPGPDGASRVRLIATFGSVVWHYPMAAESTLALVSAALAATGERLAASKAGCRTLHVDWPAWAGERLGERPDLAAAMEQAGFAPMRVAEGSRLLLRAMANAGVPDRIALHGRVGLQAPPVIAAATGLRPAGRFAEQVIVHYPGAELIVQARLSRQADPYLADYRVDGMPVLPPAMALEALAQTASTVAGQLVRTASEVTMTAPVVLPPGSPGSATLIRICALRTADAVTAVLRCESSDFRVDHYRAVFSCDPAASGQPQPQPQTQAQPATPGSAGHADQQRARQSGLGGEAVDGSELYGPILFQAGRFRRLAAIHAVSGRSVTATARGTDDVPWFGTEPPAGSPEHHGLVLGSPGLADATLQVVQACVPHRRLVPVRCESVTFGAAAADGQVTIRAVEVAATLAAGSSDGRGPAADVAVPRQRACAEGEQQAPPAPATMVGQHARTQGQVTAAETTWDIQAVDAAGHLLISWRRLVMRDAGPLPRKTPWPVALLPGYLERAAKALGLDPALEIRLGRRRAAGLNLEVAADGPAACGWQLVKRTGPRPVETAVQAAITACLRAGSVPASVVPGEPRGSGDGWQVHSAGPAIIACTVLEVAGLASPVAIALMTGCADADGSRAAARPGRERQEQLASRVPSPSQNRS